MATTIIDLLSYIEKGGIIVKILIVLNITGFTVMLWKLLVLKLARHKNGHMVYEIIDTIKNHNLNFTPQLLENSIQYQIQKLEHGLGTIKVIAVISPLLGLLGTVTGVLMAFETVASKGLGNPADFSNGVSVALITTVAGLVVAIPHYIGYNYFISLLDTIETELEKEVLEKL